MADKSQRPDLVSECHTKNTQLLSIIFSDKIKNADVTEFLVVIQKTERILNDISQQKYYQIIDPNSLSFKIFQRSLERVDTILNEYIKSFLQILNRAHSDQQMNRILNNSNLRRNLEQINSALLSEVTALEEKHQYVQRELNTKQHEDTSPTAKITQVPSDPPISSTEIVDSEVKGIIQDKEGRIMWEQKIGPKKLMAEWAQFIAVYSKCINQSLKEDQQKVLRRILDPSNTGSVSANRFAEFLKGFGPLSNSMQNVSKLLSQPWFWGFVSVEESQKYLECAAVGTFLIRFSSTKAGSFSISFTSGPSQVTHVQIAPKNESTNISSGFGFAIKEEGGEKIFPSIEAIVSHYSSVLTLPFQSDIPELEYFFGDFDASEAEEVLSGKEIGTFLIRFSSQPGCFAGSYVDTNKQVAKCLIASKPAYYIADQEGKNYGSFKTMRELVQAFNMTFKIPYKKSTNEVNNAIRYRIANEILDTEKSYLRALNTLLQVFVEPLRANNSVISLADTHTIFSNMDEIRKIQQSFLSKLDPIVTKWSDQSLIGHLFVELEQPLKSYSVYVNNYDASAKCINNHLTAKNSQFKKFIDQCLQKPECDQSSLSSYLIQPVQRIPRYILLLSDLLKNTPSSHDDYANLEAGLAAVKRVAEHINESKRSAENFAKLLHIQSNLTSEIEKFSLTDRSLVKDGDVLEKNKKSGFSERYMLLTADSLVLLKKKKEKFTFKGLVSLRNASVEEAGCADVKDEKIFMVQILATSSSLTASSEIQSVTIGVKTESEKNIWKNLIQETIDTLNHPERADRELKKNISTLTLMSSNLFIGNTRSNSFGTPPVTRKSASPSDIPSKRHVSLSSASTPTNLSSSPITTPQIPSPQKSPSQNFNQQSLWKQAQTQDGRVYYYNVATRQTSWTLPTDN